jgi:hypothetical protein
VNLADLPDLAHVLEKFPWITSLIYFPASPVSDFWHALRDNAEQELIICRVQAQTWNNFLTKDKKTVQLTDLTLRLPKDVDAKFLRDCLDRLGLASLRSLKLSCQKEGPGWRIHDMDFLKGMGQLDFLQLTDCMDKACDSSAIAGLTLLTTLSITSAECCCPGLALRRDAHAVPSTSRMT